MITGFKKNAITVQKAAQMSEQELDGKITIGVLADRELPVSTEEYEKIRHKAREKKK